MKRYIFITILFYLVFLTFVSYRVSKAYFTDMAVASSNTFTAASEFPLTPTPTGSETPKAEIVINEVFAFGDVNVEWVELHNKSGSPINVSGWEITDNNSSDTFPSVPDIPSGGYAVVIASESAVSVPGGVVQIQLTGTNIGNGLANDGDGISISDTGDNVIDAMNYGTNTTFFTPSALTPISGNSLSRSPNGTDTDTATDWTLDATSSIGVSND